MVAAHYAYNMIKIPATWGVLTIEVDIRDAVFCIAEMDKQLWQESPTTSVKQCWRMLVPVQVRRRSIFP
jgi:hypothetical protein